MDTTINPGLPKLNFPTKLLLILSNPEYSDIICWLPHGRAWRVQQQERFSEEILPKYFQHQKFSSFARQVTGWGFHRISSGRDYNAYYHELFLRDNPDLCNKMKRPTRTELSERKRSLPKTPPDFYQMPTVSQDDTDTSTAFDPTSSTAITIDEYKETLVRRLSTYSLAEKGMYLQLELNKLEKRKKKILRKLEEFKAHQSISSPSQVANNSLPTIPLPLRHHPHVQMPQAIGNSQEGLLPRHRALAPPSALRDQQVRDRILELFGIPNNKKY